MGTRSRRELTEQDLKLMGLPRRFWPEDDQGRGLSFEKVTEGRHKEVVRNYIRRLDEMLSNGYGLMFWGGYGCLTGDTIINTSRATLGRPKTIKHLYNMFHRPDLIPTMTNFNPNIKTFTRSLIGDRIGLHKIHDVVYSGPKEVLRLTLENGKQITGTPEHKIMTANGWERLDNCVGKSVMCDTLKAVKHVSVKTKARDKTMSARFHPYGRQWGKNTVMDDHRLIYESFINNMTLSEFVNVVNTDKEACKQLRFVNPDTHEIHHKDFNHANNDITNLQCLTIKEHRAIHNVDRYGKFGQGIPSFSRGTALIFCGVQDTYDIVCDDPYHNFVANGIVVHNSGKSALASLICHEARRIDRIVYFVRSFELRDAVINKRPWDDGISVDDRVRKVDLLVIDDFGKEYSDMPRLYIASSALGSKLVVIIVDFRLSDL